MRVVLYLRRSTIDLQPDSLEVQEEVLRKYAAEQGHEVVRVYRDSASGRSVEGREQFQLLIEKVKSGPDFEGILVRDVSRWSRAENTDEAGFYEFICRSHNVHVIYAEESFGPDASPYSLLMKSVKRAMAAEFSLEKARVVHFSQARLARLGFWVIGSAPYGMRRMLVNEAGEPIRELLAGDRKALSNQRVKLAPGKLHEREVVRRIFRSYASDGKSVAAIAGLLNAEGIPSSKGSAWTAGMIAYTLRNEAYAGTVVYCVRNGERPSQLFNIRDAGSERIARCEGAHEALVPRELWEEAQVRLKASSHRRTDADLLVELANARERWRQV